MSASAAPVAVQRIASGPTDTEVLLWTCQEMYVYQIPPLKNESGHRANDWNVEKWLWSGRLRLMSKGTMLKVLLEDATSGELFATNLFNSNGVINSSVQCGESICGDPFGGSNTGGVFYDNIIRPRLIGIKVSKDF